MTGASLARIASRALLPLIPGLVLAQVPGAPATVVAAVALSGLRTRHPDGGPMAVGAALGVERRVHRSASLRLVASADKDVVMVDDIALCHVTPTGCLPDAVFPNWMYGLRVEAALGWQRWPLRLVTGLGAMHATRPREYRRYAPVLPLEAVTSLSWRAGLEIPLGSSPRAPTMQVTRTGFGASPYSVSAVDALSFTFRPSARAQRSRP